MNLTYHDLIFLALPGILAYINNPTWDPRIKWLLALLACFLGAFIEIWLTGQCDLQNFPATLGKVVALVMGSYATFWKAPLGKGSLSDRIENNHGTGS